MEKRQRYQSIKEKIELEEAEKVQLEEAIDYEELGYAGEEYKGDDYYDKKFADSDAMYDLELFAENDGELYNRRFMPIIENIKKKMKSQKYDHKKAPKLWAYYVEDAAKKYAKEVTGDPQSWKDMFIKKDRDLLAQKLADIRYDDIVMGNYD
jgi:hypothetical protein